jgi:ADP-ribose pyrophosphatase YjhB (NUDIX family)
VSGHPVSLARIRSQPMSDPSHQSGQSDHTPADFLRDLLRWGESLAGIARTGLAFTQSLYERERYEEVLHVAADILAAADEELEVRRERDHYVQEWLDSVGVGVPGYVTPKVAIGAVVGNDAGQILLVQRADSGIWLYPTGWADVGYSPAEVAVKEVLEETGIECEPLQLLAVIDGMRMGFTRTPLYSLVFHCRATGGELRGHPLETSDVGWFDRDALPSPVVGMSMWGPSAFAAIDGATIVPTFDAPRPDVWQAHAAAVEQDADEVTKRLVDGIESAGT